jgi:hypothetical protein
MSSKHGMLLIAGIVCVLVVGNVGSSSAAALTSRAASSPCSWLTPAEIHAAANVNVAAGAPIATTGCQWNALPGQTSSPIAMVTVSTATAREFAASRTPIGTAITRSEVRGIGDDAIYTTMGKLVTLGVKKGDHYFVVRMYGDHYLAHERAVEKALANYVIAKL